MNYPLPPMPVHVADLMSDSDCRQMSDAEFGRYLRLLFRQWEEGSVPASPHEAVKDAGLDAGSEGSVGSILEAKFDVKDDVCLNAKCAAIRATRLAQAEKRRANGKLGGRPKKNAPARKPAGASPAKPAADGRMHFNRFWSSYPRKVGKRKAEMAWASRKLGNKITEIMDALQRAKRSHDWVKDGGKFIPHPTTWLNRDGWEDQLSSPTTGKPADKYDSLSEEFKRKLFVKLVAENPTALHVRGSVDTERAMRKLAETYGVV